MIGGGAPVPPPGADAGQGPGAPRTAGSGAAAFTLTAADRRRLHKRLEQALRRARRRKGSGGHAALTIAQNRP